MYCIYLATDRTKYYVSRITHCMHLRMIQLKLTSSQAVNVANMPRKTEIMMPGTIPLYIFHVNATITP